MMTKDVHNKSNSIAFVWYIMNSVDPLLNKTKQIEHMQHNHLTEDISDLEYEKKKSNGIKNELIIISVT